MKTARFSLKEKGIELRIIKEEFSAVIKADQRGNERFDVLQGIPSSETLYANVIADEYLYNFKAEKASDEVEYTVTVVYEPGEELQWFRVLSIIYTYQHDIISALLTEFNLQQ